MSVVKQALFAGAIFTAALLLLALTGCRAAPTTNSSVHFISRAMVFSTNTGIFVLN